MQLRLIHVQTMPTQIGAQLVDRAPHGGVAHVLRRDQGGLLVNAPLNSARGRRLMHVLQAKQA